MKRYPDGADGELFFMKRAPTPRPDVDRDLRHHARLGQRHRLPDDPGPAVAALGHQPRLHRPQPLVCALRRRRSPRLPPLRPRPRPEATFAAVRRDGAAGRRDARGLGIAADRQDDRLAGLHVYVPIVRGPTAEAGLELRQALAVELGRATRRHHRRLRASPSAPRAASSSTTTRTAWGRTLASVYSAAAEAARHRLDAGRAGGELPRVSSPTSTFSPVPRADARGGAWGAAGRPHDSSRATSSPRRRGPRRLSSGGTPGFCNDQRGGRMLDRIALAAVVVLAGCGGHSDPIATVVRQYAVNLDANYKDVIAQLEALQAAVDAFVAEPSADAQLAAQQAWLAARPAYGECEYSRFYGGPIDEAQGGMNEWPIDENFIDYTADNPTGGIINDPQRLPADHRAGARDRRRAGRHREPVDRLPRDRVPAVGPAPDQTEGPGRAPVHRLRRRRHRREPGSAAHLPADRRPQHARSTTCAALDAAVGPDRPGELRREVRRRPAARRRSPTSCAASRRWRSRSCSTSG